jgi:hypothetical protein
VSRLLEDHGQPNGIERHRRIFVGTDENKSPVESERGDVCVRTDTGIQLALQIKKLILLDLIQMAPRQGPGCAGKYLG